ncbi:hypothetical protein [Bradyrhizobium sp. 1]|uniref:hypothetical protein n=1 Tax=Bradyrhizobium sp. 1 TaxID=241591 RepID=UPI001FFB33F2|nr:hypothetical protein [Bradyrhizobium sp. 1]MCK1391682.1 hypothetical protein [Bradyrhizobium sp. 1]
MRYLIISAYFLLTITESVAAQCKLERVIGYTLVAAKTVVAHIDDGKREDGFSGCTYGRILVFDDNTGVRCAEYNYEYAYRPDAYIFVRGGSIKMCIEGYLYDANSLN